MKFEIFLSRQARKFLDKLDAAARSRIVEKIKLLAENSFALPYKKIKGRDRTYSVRIGGYRIIYSVRNSEVRILRIDKRESLRPSLKLSDNLAPTSSPHEPPD